MLRMCGDKEHGSAEAQSAYRAKALEGIEREAVRIAEIVARVRRYARTVSSSHSPVDLTEMLARSIRALQAEQPDVRIEADFASRGRALRVLGDPLELELLFLNLLRNAAEASSRAVDRKSTPITVDAVILKHDSSAGRGSGQNQVVRVTIENDGPIWSPVEIAEINSHASGFIKALKGENDLLEKPNLHASQGVKALPGSSSSDESAGLGLGLTICRGIADSHGAALRFEGRPEGGVCVEVVFDLIVHSDSDGRTRRTIGKGDD